MTFAPLATLLSAWCGRHELLRTLGAMLTALALTAFYWNPCWEVLPAARTESLASNLDETFFFPDFRLWQPLHVPDSINHKWLVIFLGLVAVTALLLRIWLRGRTVDRLIGLNSGRFLLAVIVLALMLPVRRPLYHTFPPLEMVQFAWRLLTPGMPILGGSVRHGPAPSSRGTIGAAMSRNSGEH